jgi:hypothetical protein
MSASEGPRNWKLVVQIEDISLSKCLVFCVISILASTLSQFVTTKRILVLIFNLGLILPYDMFLIDWGGFYRHKVATGLGFDKTPEPDVFCPPGESPH